LVVAVLVLAVASNQDNQPLGSAGNAIAGSLASCAGAVGTGVGDVALGA